MSDAQDKAATRGGQSGALRLSVIFPNESNPPSDERQHSGATVGNRTPSGLVDITHGLGQRSLHTRSQNNTNSLGNS
eukprot:COSAG02_NODE_8890_length_2406_cov_9.409182_2_plen_77_part_00